MSLWTRLVACQTPKVLAALFTTTLVANADPIWWEEHGAVNPQAPRDDYARLNLGQLKNMARAGRIELDAFYAGSGGAGSTIRSLVDGWISSSTTADDYAVCNIGQMKAVSKLFWDRLIALNRATAYPWTAATSDDDDYSPANLGQLKTVFNISTSPDADGDRLRDDWELKYASGLTRLSPTLDADGDGLNDKAEYLFGSNPLSRDTDGDGFPDSSEKAYGTNPNDRDTNDDGVSDGISLRLSVSPNDNDVDDDGLTNVYELQTGTNPFSNNSDRDGSLDNADVFPTDSSRTSLGAPVSGDVAPPGIQIIGPTPVTAL